LKKEALGVARKPTSVWEVLAIAPEGCVLRKARHSFSDASTQFRCPAATLHHIGANSD
jgi:hypothetical protein